MLVTVVLQLLELAHEKQVHPLVVINDWDVTLFEHTSLSFDSSLTLMGKGRMVQVTMFLDNINKILLSAFL